VRLACSAECYKTYRKLQKAEKLAERERWLQVWFTLTGETLDSLMAELIEGRRFDGLPMRICHQVAALIRERRLRYDNAIKISQAMQSLARSPAAGRPGPIRKAA
jgi:hypothetical protein